MFHAKLFRFLASFVLLGIVIMPQVHALTRVGNNTIVLPPESEAFLPVSAAQRTAWERVIEDCFPVNTRTALSSRCMASLGEYFPNEPVWTYNDVFVYDWRGLNSLSHGGCNQRRDFTPADFLNPDVPLWSDIFDDQIAQRQELFLRVVNDLTCQDLASRETEGIHDDLADQCAAREMYQYAAYLSACLDATQRLTSLQKIVTEPDAKRSLNLFESSFALMELDGVADEALRAGAKRVMEKSFLHVSWVAAQCKQHGLVLRPGVTNPAITLPTGETIDAYTTTAEKLRWGELTGLQVSDLRISTHEFIMKIAMRSGDDWAIRSGALSGDVVGGMGADLMQRYPLLMHRLLGDKGGVLGSRGFSVDFTGEERLRHRAKAYLLLVEVAGEEFARGEYDPEPLAQQIKYVEAGGVLKTPLTRAERIEKRKERERQRDAKKELQEIQGEEFK